MRVGPSEPEYRLRFQITFKLLQLRVVVVSVKRKGSAKNQISMKKTMYKNHLQGVDRVIRCQNRGSLSPRDKEERPPVYCSFGIRRIDGVIFIQAFTWNTRTCHGDVKRKLQAIRHSKKESINALYRDGASRSSDDSLRKQAVAKGMHYLSYVHKENCKTGGTA